MSMHLHHPSLSLNGKKRGKVKFRNAAEAQRAAADEAKRQAKLHLEAQAKEREKKELQVLAAAAQAKAQVQAQREAVRRERELAAEKDRQRADAAAALLAKQRVEEKAALQRRKEEREAFEARQEAAKRLMQKRAADRERDIAAAANAIRQARVDAHNKAVKDREERAAARAAAQKKLEKQEKDNAKLAEARVEALAKQAFVNNAQARQAGVLWPGAVAVVNNAAPVINASPSPQQPRVQDRVSAEARALNERRKANLARFEAEILARNRQKNQQNDAGKAAKAALLERRDLALMVKGLPVNVSDVLRANVKAGNLAAQNVPGPVVDPVQNPQDGDPFWGTDDTCDNSDENDDGSDIDIAVAAMANEENACNEVLAIDVDLDIGSQDGSDFAPEFDIQEDADTDEEPSQTPGPNLKPKLGAAQPQLRVPAAANGPALTPKSPAWLNNLEAQMGRLQSDVAGLQISPRSNVASNVNTPRTGAVAASPNHIAGSATPASTPLAIRALGKIGFNDIKPSEAKYAVNQHGIPRQGVPRAGPQSVANKAISNAAVKHAPSPPAQDISPEPVPTAEEKAQAAAQRRATQQQRQADLRAYVKLQREQRIKEKNEVILETSDTEDIEPPPYSDHADASDMHISQEDNQKATQPHRRNRKPTTHEPGAELLSSKSAPALVILRNPLGIDYEPVLSENSQKVNQRKGDIIAALPAHEFNYLSNEAPLCNYKPSVDATQKSAKGLLLVVENAPGSLQRKVRPASAIASAARSRTESDAAAKLDPPTIVKNNPRTGHALYQVPAKIEKPVLHNRISTKPRVPSSIVPSSPKAHKETAGGIEKPGISSRQNAVSMSLAEKKKAREQERAAMHEAMREQRNKAKAKARDDSDDSSPIEFDIRIPEGKSPYYNPGQGPVPIQHKKLVGVSDVPASYVNGPFADGPSADELAAAATLPAQAAENSDLPPAYTSRTSDNNTAKEDKDLHDMHNTATAAEMDLAVLLQQMQDIVNKFHRRVSTNEQELLSHPELTGHNTSALPFGQTQKSLKKALHNIRHLEGTLQLARQLTVTLNSTGTTVTYDGNEIPEMAPPLESDDDEDTLSVDPLLSDNDCFGEEEEELERRKEGHGADNAETATTLSSEFTEDQSSPRSHDLGDYRFPLVQAATIDMANDAPLMSLDQLLEQDDVTAADDDHADSHSISDSPIHSESVLPQDKCIEIEIPRRGMEDADQLFSSDLENDESEGEAGDIPNEHGHKRTPLKAENQEEKAVVHGRGLRLTPLKSPHRSRWSLGGSNSPHKNETHRGSETGVIAEEDVLNKLDELNLKFGRQPVLQALGILRNSLDDQFIADGEELSAEDEEIAREQEDRLLLQLEGVLGPDGLMHLDSLFALCQCLEQMRSLPSA